MSDSLRTAHLRLPTNVKPTHYDITVKTDLEKLAFQGLVKISLDINEDISTIILNTLYLELGNTTLYSYVSKTEHLITPSFDEIQERVSYRLAERLPAGSKAELKIAFSGKLGSVLLGYHKSSWEYQGKTRYYACTQLAPTAARRVFPCWDEPLLKATFAVTLISRADTVNLNNMPVITEHVIEPGQGVPADLSEIIAAPQNEKWKISKFGTTPPMSTYLVAIANGPFEFVESSVVMPLSGKTVPLRVYATADVIHQAKFALDVKAAVLPLYEKTFDVEYPLPKLDTLVVHDSEGAMENWGLITGQPKALLLDPERAELNGKRQVAWVESHEIAHMWFGNITTMEWWDTLYLNEGFATIMGEVIILVKIFPEFRLNSDFITRHLETALALDCKASSHPIEVPILDAKDIHQIFDSLSYSKAASVLRMLSNYVGEEKFLQGVSLYLKKKRFANSVTHDLWEGIATATGIDIIRLMDNWITKIGYPVLTVTEDDRGIIIRQDRFLQAGAVDPEDNETIWSIPLNLALTESGRTFIDTTAILEEREKVVTLDTSLSFKLNANTVGFYRVLYTHERLTKIAVEAAKEDSVFTMDDKIGLLQDAFALSHAGLAKVSSALALVDLWRNEKEFYVWRVMGASIDQLLSIWWENSQVLDKLNAFRRTLFVPLVAKLGFDYPENESVDTQLLRTLAIEQAANAGDGSVVKELQSRFKHYLQTGDNSKIPANLQNIIFSTAVKYGGSENYDAMIRIYEQPKTPSDTAAAIRGLGSPQDISVLEKTTRYITDKSRDTDITTFFTALAANFKARRLLTRYMQEEFDTIYKRVESNFSLGYAMKIPFDFYSNQTDYDATESFFKSKDTSKFNKVVAQTLESIQTKTHYVERSTEDLAGWLERT